jgi:hypothetical protein
MTVISDFIHILGDPVERIGDGSNESGWTKSFNTGGRRSSSNAFISFMVKGMTVTNENADVFVNDTKIGVLYKSTGANSNHWQTQSVSLSGGTLRDGNNVLRVSPVINQTDNTDDFDDFFVTNVICHFHQSV